MDVQFKTPFYHNAYGLLGSGSDNDTIYTLPDDVVLPKSAVVISGKSQHRKDTGEPKRAHKKDGTFIADDPNTPDVNEAYEAGYQPARRTPVEGKSKADISSRQPKKRAAKKL